MTTYGYARVSTRDQDLAAQDAELMAAGCAKVFKEKVSGAKTDRPELAKAIGRLESGDVLVVTRLDRLARSTRDLLNVLDEIGKRGAGFKSLKDTWADTTSPHGRLMLTVLGGLAEFERELIRARTGWRNATIFNTNHSLNETRRKKLQMCTRTGCGIGRQNVTIRRGIRRRWDVVQLFSQRPPGADPPRRLYPEVLVGSIRSFYVCKLHY
jgi:hypothetical protein